MSMDFGAGREIEAIRDALAGLFGRVRYIPRRSPIGQLVKSLISSRTKDEVSLAAYDRLVGAHSNWSDVIGAGAEAVEAAISTVKFPDVKAPHLIAALQAVAATHPDFDLDFLAGQPVETALAWLERLPGVGRKVAASALNFSTLDRPAFVVDTHVLRVLRRFGLVAPKATTEAAYGAVMQATVGWSSLDLAELHVLLKSLGQTVCTHRLGACCRCLIGNGCKTAARMA